MPTVPASRVSRRRTPAAAVVLSIAVFLGLVLSGCEYEYSADNWDDEPTAVPAAPTTGAAPPPDFYVNNEPVTGEELTEWAEDALPDAEGRVFQASFGSVESGEPHTESTTPLPSGTYALTMACRSTSRVAFAIRNGAASLVDLSLPCRGSRVSVVQLPADAVLSIEVTGLAAANFAYRISRI